MRSLVMLLAALGVACAQSDVGRELVTNGSFEAHTKEAQWPDGYQGDRRAVQYLAEDGNRFVRIESRVPGQATNGSVGQTLRIAPDWFRLRVRIKVRLKDVVRGTEGWHDARVAMSFHDAAGKQVGGWPNVMNWSGSTDGWTVQERLYKVPDGATELRITPALFSATGRVDFDDFSVTVVSLRPKLEDAPLPEGVVAEWGLAKAWRERTGQRERVCLNGLWRFCPQLGALPAAPRRPANGQGWGWLKVPAAWPGRGLEVTKPLGPDIWENLFEWSKLTAGWYEREITVPADWAGRKTALTIDMPQTEALVLVDGQPVGSVRWPAGRVDLSGVLQPGQQARLTVLVTTDPLAKERLVAMREDFVEKIRAEVRFRGLCGDLFLVAEPSGARLGTVQVRPSVRRQALGLSARLADLDAGATYHLEAVASRNGEEAWRGRSGTLGGAGQGDFTCQLPWPQPALWDFERPNLYDLDVSLRNAAGEVLDTMRTRFGFREFWIEGRDLMLNGRPVHWRAADYHAVSHDGGVTKPFARRAFARLRSLGFNFIILGNYGLDPGQTPAFGELLEAADEAGFALSFSLPHVFSEFTDRRQGLGDDWQKVARYAVETVGNHPSVLAYAANHNRLGYYGDQNPEKMDGVHQHEPPKAASPWFYQGRERAAEGEAFVRRLDPTRELYHHQSGHMGAWHTVNIYLNWSPAQERSEWLSHWAQSGRKPLFFVEWGPPHQASWGGHRQGPFIWRNKVNSEPLAVEYGAMHTGDAAYEPDPVAERYVDTYERVYAKREPFHISQVFSPLWGAVHERNYIELKSLYTDIVWPRLRTWGISAILPWDQGDVALAPGDSAAEYPVATDWAALQRPGRAPDFERTGGDYFQSRRENWMLTSFGRSFQRWNQPVIAYLAGAPERFTEREHNVRPGQRITKQAILVNDSADTVTAAFSWYLTVGRTTLATGDGTLTAPAGGQQRVPFTVTVPAEPRGEFTLSLVVRLPEPQADSLKLHSLAAQPAHEGRLAVFDPHGLTLAALKAAGVAATPVTAESNLEGFDGLVLGREAITLDNRLPDLAAHLARGGRVVVMEQSEQALTRRCGFRCNDPSLRQAFVRVAGHVALDGLTNPLLADWCGSATLLPDRLPLPAAELSDPPKDWLGFANTRVWKWGNAGQVASVVIEKPQRGDFTSVIEGGFDLQYAALLQQRLSVGEILWCQMDVTGRTKADPAAEQLFANLLSWCGQRLKRRPALVARYVGGEDGAALLRSLGAQHTIVPAASAAGDGVVVVGPGVGASLGPHKAAISAAVERGATVVVLPQKADGLTGWLPFEVQTKTDRRTVSPVPAGRWFVGLGPGDLHWRGRREVLLVGTDGLAPNVVNAVPHGRGAYVFCQVVPTDFDYRDEYRVYLKRTANRTAVMLSRLLANAGAAFETPVEGWTTPAPPPAELAGEWQAVRDEQGRFQVGDLVPTLPWRKLNVPGTFEAQVPEWANYDGVIWYRRTFEWRGPTDRTATLRLGKVDDEDWTFVNGEAVGHIGQDTHPTNYWSAPRLYALRPGLLKAGANTIVVKVRDLRQSGGIVSGPVDVRLPDRWLSSYYLDTPAQLDDPYRYNRW